jgi:hypothetical protein
MLNISIIRPRFTKTLNFVSNQNYDDITLKLNTAGWAFDATEGLGVTTATSSIALINAGGFADQKITASMKYVSPTTSANYEIGVMCRVKNTETVGGGANYYYARIGAGTAKLTKVINGTFTNLATHAFTLNQNSLVTISLSAIGSQLTAVFDDGAGNVQTLNASDSAIASGGMYAIRSLTSTVYCRSATVEEQ